MTTTSSMRYLVNGVTNWFATHAPSQGTLVVYGWRNLSEQTEGSGGGNRVGFALGDQPGNAGRLKSPQKTRNDGNPKIKATWEKVLTVTVWGYDASNPTDELLQFDAFESLLEQTVTAIREVLKADTEPVSSMKMHPFEERSFGLEGMFQLLQSSPLYGLTRDFFPATPQTVVPLDITKEYST